MSKTANFFTVAVLAFFLLAGLGIASAYSGEAPSVEPTPGAKTGEAAGTTPKIEAAPELFDFGTVDEGVKPKAIFTIKNIGGSELVIYDAKPSCGCTLAKLSKKKLMPGETATLEAVYNSSHSRGGAVSKYVTVKTNDPTTPSKILRITGKVNPKPAPILTIDPVRVDNLKLASGEVEKRLVHLRNTGQLDLHITEITATKGISARLEDLQVDAGKTVKMKMTIEPGQSKDMDVSIAPVVEKGARFQEAVTIRSDSKDRPATAYLAKGVVQQ